MSAGLLPEGFSAAIGVSVVTGSVGINCVSVGRGCAVRVGRGCDVNVGAVVGIGTFEAEALQATVTMKTTNTDK
jgi:hypothetical protein